MGRIKVQSLHIFCAIIRMLGIVLCAGMAENSSAVAAVCDGAARKVELACSTWTEIDLALKHSQQAVILPIGGTEQSGPYLAVGKHNVRVQRLADDIAEKVGATFVAPVVAYVPEGSTSPRRSHMRFPGTLSVPPKVFSGVVEGAAESLAVQGFKTVFLLGDHGGYQDQLASIAQKLERKWNGKAHCFFVREYYERIPNEYAQELRRQGYGSAVGKHADLSDTSLMLSVDPSLVRQGALRVAPKLGSADGVYGGDPRQATAMLGRIGTEMQVRAAVEAISSFNRSHP